MSSNTVTDRPTSMTIAYLAPLLCAAALSIGATVWLANTESWFEASLLTLGAALGLVLYHAAFGFTTAWRALIIDGRGKGLRAQMLMLAVAVCLFFPALAAGDLFGNDVSGFVRPLGWSIIIGAFVFGIGMQLGNGCASGNLYHAGGGQLRALPCIIGFTVGALWASKDYEWWTTLPQFAPYSFIEQFGVIQAIIMNLALFAVIAWLTVVIEKRRHGSVEKDALHSSLPLYRQLISGPWPFIWGAIALAILNFITLAMIGRPWAVAVAYPLWGAKMAAWLEVDLELDFWTYWMQPGRESALMEPLTTDAGTLMNAGIIIGALMAAALAGKLTIQWRMPWQHWIAAIIGGLMLGYGATIAFGCNIGAYFGGIASGSLHGWLWLVAAFIGSIIGTWIRPVFKLSNTATTQRCN
ncbi:YeeE/YedE family protein [Neptunomonas sp.]|uniref:YeeE/YedE family protein n=1 Tax=Neptunomonas sp. TaxID=1971898 RepID=UPI0035652C7B